jgi:colicin import membrane protein
MSKRFDFKAIFLKKDRWPGTALSWMLLSSAIVLIILMALVVKTSYANIRKYYLKTSDGAVEIWQGTFSPAGKKRLVIMAGVQPPPAVKRVYTREEVFPIIAEYYILKADALMDVPGMPDFNGIKSYLNRALAYTIMEQQRAAIQSRLNRIDVTILLYKADVAAGKNTLAGFETAMNYLDQAAALKSIDIESEFIEKKKKQIGELINLQKAANPP